MKSASLQAAKVLTKKEISMLFKRTGEIKPQLIWYPRNEKTPGLVIVVDPKPRAYCCERGNKLGIPILGLVDTQLQSRSYRLRHCL